MIDWDNLSRCTVLVIDDEPDNVEIVLMALRFYGATVHTAESGAQGLEALKNLKPDLILLDLSMHGMDGWETRARIKADPALSDAPIVALTAHAMAGDRERALDAGFDGYLSKPISVRTLIKDLRAALDERPAPVDSEQKSEAS